jgi:hypothetical protein
MRWVTAGAAGFVAAAMLGCGAAEVATERLGITARDAFLEGRTVATTWDSGAQLRWMEGVGIAGTGAALPGVGEWRLHYTAPGRNAGLVVTVGSVDTGQEERSPTSPPGFVLGAERVAEPFIDSPEALSHVLAERGGAVPETATAMLVPGQPQQWVITFPDDTRRWLLDARTGQLRSP